MPFFDQPGGALYYHFDQGHQHTITLIHGVGADHESWRWVIEHFEQSFNILSFDLRGHGQSVKDGGPYSLALFAADTIALLDYLQIEKTHLFGFSLGGLIAQQLAISFQHRLHSVAIISSVAGRSDAEKTAVAERVKMLEQTGAIAHLNNAVDRWFSNEFRRNNPEILEWRRLKSLQNDPASYLAAYRVLATSDLDEQISKIEIPCLVMTGENDIGSTPRMSEYIGERVQNGRVVILPDLKHSLLLEAPDRVAVELERFISGLA
ncbi:MAG: pimeloyl-ACP methyl ester carboxylesterase [Planctomycetota bacterium]|jgi:pimeloyl-ACP methyl ester carboxylesterase